MGSWKGWKRSTGLVIKFVREGDTDLQKVCSSSVHYSRARFYISFVKYFATRAIR
jgi:hypothetical protein